MYSPVMTTGQRVSILAQAPQERGASIYTTCPSCGRAKKLSISHLEDGSILYHCFRPLCALHRGGSITPNGVRTLSTKATTVTYVTRPYTGVIESLPDEVKTPLYNELGFDDWHTEMGRPMWAPEDLRVAFPILNPMGTRDGWCLRSYSGQEPKSLTRMDVARPSHSYYGCNTGPTIVVEDIPSALRASRYLNSIALLGTGLGNDAAIEIAANRSDVIFALDKDATAQALRLQSRHRLLFNNSSVLFLGTDLKDMNEDDLAALLIPLGGT